MSAPVVPLGEELSSNASRSEQQTSMVEVEQIHIRDQTVELEEEEEEEDVEEVPSCTYTSSLPLDPAASCALQARLSATLGVRSVSFSGCGAFYPYMYGIACYLQDYYDLSDVHFLGTSGGCLPALTLCTGLDVREAFFQKWNNHVIAESSTKKLKAYFSFISTCEKHAKLYFPEDIHERANGRLHLSSSRVHLSPARGWSVWNTLRAIGGGVRLLQNCRTSYWSDKNDLIDSVAASTYIPILAQSGLFKNWRGEWHLDGGLTDNQPILDRETIQLQPFMFQAASFIRKASFIYIRLSPEWHASLFKKGYEHARDHGEKVFSTLRKKTADQFEKRPILPPELEERLRMKKNKNTNTHHHHHTNAAAATVLAANAHADPASKV